MSYSIFLDTSLNITIGLLDEDYNWIDYIHHVNKKSASKIHSMLYESLEKNNLKLESVDTLFYCSGPGSYTGMRVSEGIARLLEWQGIKTRSFYHYQIPRFCDINSGKWVANAYKGEMFIYAWEGDEEQTELLSVENNKVSEFSFSHDTELVQSEKHITVNMIYENPKKVFSEIEKNEKALQLNYYRLPENEFKLKKKKNE
jgi:tRNA threonylcarbamoyladenosine biosynthesis protein TsaB